MESRPLVSVIIPVYNVRSFLTQALDSVVHQTYTNLDIIVIDDGSTDGSGEICDQYAQKDKRVVVIHQDNKGLSAARNAGLDRAQGAMVAFLDSDDAYDFSFIESMVSVMVREGADIVICRYSVHKTMSAMEKGNCRQTEPAIRPGKYDRDDAIRALFDGSLNFSVWNKLYTRGIWGAKRFPDGHVYEDVEITYRLYAQSHRVFVLDTPLYMYRGRTGSIVATASIKNMEDRLLSRSRSEAFIRDNTPDVFSVEQLETYKQRRLAGMVQYYARLYQFSESERAELEKKLRKEIISAGTETKPNMSRTKAAYFMICSCPGLFRIIQTAYHFGKRCVKFPLKGK